MSVCLFLSNFFCVTFPYNSAKTYDIYLKLSGYAHGGQIQIKQDPVLQVPVRTHNILQFIDGYKVVLDTLLFRSGIKYEEPKLCQV